VQKQTDIEAIRQGLQALNGTKIGYGLAINVEI
jgi:hypothetical protein